MKYPKFIFVSYVRSLLNMFVSVFPYKNKVGRFIMDTEKAHSVKHSHIDVLGFANPLNCSCDGPEGGHKRWVKLQGAKTNQGDTSALTMMEHTLRKEASELLCSAVQSRINDGERPDEIWTDSKGRPIPPTRQWEDSKSQTHPSHTDESEGPCMGIRINIWERAKKRKHLVHILQGGRGNKGGYDALNHMLIIHGDAGHLGKYPVLSLLPDKFVRFLYEFHHSLFQRLDLPPLPHDRSDIDVHRLLSAPQKITFTTFW